MRYTSNSQRDFLVPYVYSIAHLADVYAAIRHLHIPNNQQSICVIHASVTR